MYSRGVPYPLFFSIFFPHDTKSKYKKKKNSTLFLALIQRESKIPNLHIADFAKKKYHKLLLSYVIEEKCVLLSTNQKKGRDPKVPL